MTPSGLVTTYAKGGLVYIQSQVYNVRPITAIIETIQYKDDISPMNAHYNNVSDILIVLLSQNY